MSKAAIRKFLAGRSSQQLAQEILILHDRFPEIREYLSARVELESSAKTFEKYTRLIDQEFRTSVRNPKGRPSEGRRILRAYRQVAVSNEEVIELTLYYVSVVLRFMEAFGILEDAYIRTVVSAFREASELAAKHKVENAAGTFEEVIKEAAAVWDMFDVHLRDIARQNGLLVEGS